MKANFYSVTDTVNFPTTPSYNFTSTIYVPNVFICSGKTTFFLSTFILNCFSKLSAISFDVILPNVFPFSPAFVVIFIIIVVQSLMLMIFRTLRIQKVNKLKLFEIKEEINYTIFLKK